MAAGAEQTQPSPSAPAVPLMARGQHELEAPRRHLRIAAATLTALLAAFYAPLLLGEQLYRRDAWRQMLGCRWYVGERLRAGEFPGWFPYEGFGVPFHAQALSAVLHPLSWLAVVLSPERTLLVQ